MINCFPDDREGSDEHFGTPNSILSKNDFDRSLLRLFKCILVCMQVFIHVIIHKMYTVLYNYLHYDKFRLPTKFDQISYINVVNVLLKKGQV